MSSLLNPLASSVSHHELGIYNSLPPMFAKHSVDLIYCFTFLLSFPHHGHSPNSITWPPLMWLLISFLSSILRKSLSKSFFLISTTFLKGLLWCCVAKSTKAPEEAVFKTGVSTSKAHGSQAGSNVNRGLKDNPCSTEMGSGGGHYPAPDQLLPAGYASSAEFSNEAQIRIFV